MMMKKMMIMMIAITTKKSSTLLRLGVKIEQGKAETDLVFREENVPSCEALFGRKYQRRERESGVWCDKKEDNDRSIKQ